MMLLDVWPRQRANVKRKRLSKAEREYRAQVRKNKSAAAAKAQSKRVSEERASRANLRRANAELIAINTAIEVERARRKK